MPTRQRYPLSTPSGQAIPLDVIRPVGVFSISFSPYSASPPASLNNVELLLLRTTASCFVRFENASATKTDGSGTLIPNTIYIESGELCVISPPNPYYSVIGTSESGILTVQLLEVWTGLITEHQLTRI